MERSYYDYISAGYYKPPEFLPLDSNFINGRNGYNCTQLPPASNVSSACEDRGGISSFKFISNKVHLLRLINAGGLDNQKFSIDDHELTVIANDYVPVVPYTTSVVTLGVGQRTDVLVNATGSETDRVWMRADLDLNPSCGETFSSQAHALAVVFYDNATGDDAPTSNAYTWNSSDCDNVSSHGLQRGH